MYLEEAHEVFEYWCDYPPTYQLVALIARMLGWEGPEQRSEPATVPDFSFDLDPDLAESIGQAAGVPAPVVDLERMRERNRQRTIEIAERNRAKA